MNKNLLLFLLFSSAVAFGNQCSERCQGAVSEPIDICFVERDMKSALLNGRSFSVIDDFITPAVIRRACGYGSNIYPVSHSGEIESVLGELQEDCQTIGQITFFGHGRPGFMTLGLDRRSVASWSDYSCLLAPDAAVYLSGCNVGRGCLGNNLLHLLVTKLLSSPHSVGFVQAPEFYATSFFPGVIPHHSVNFTYRRVYKPSGENSALQWRSVGLGSSFFGAQGSPQAVCKSEIEQAIEGIDRHLFENSKIQCGITRITQSRIDELNRVCFEEQDAQTWGSLKRKIKTAVLDGNLSLRALSICSDYLLHRLLAVKRSCAP